MNDEFMVPCNDELMSTPESEHKHVEGYHSRWWTLVITDVKYLCLFFIVVLLDFNEGSILSWRRTEQWFENKIHYAEAQSYKHQLSWDLCAFILIQGNAQWFFISVLHETNTSYISSSFECSNIGFCFMITCLFASWFLEFILTECPSSKSGSSLLSCPRLSSPLLSSPLFFFSG